LDETEDSQVQVLLYDPGKQQLTGLAREVDAGFPDAQLFLGAPSPPPRHPGDHLHPFVASLADPLHRTGRPT
jgi:hypothetical protein